MLRIRLTVERRDGTTEELPVYPSAILDFEKYAKKGILAAFSGTDILNEHLYYLAYCVERDAGNVVKPWKDDYVRTLAGVEVLEAPKA
jgi:hypothetical protein